MSTKMEHVARIVRAISYIEDHLYEEVTVEQVAKVACYSRFHFSRIFKAITGESIKEYITRLRVQSASHRLSYSRDFITRIAQDCGYADSPTFIKAFSRIQGMSPKEYRNFLGETIQERIKSLEDSHGKIVKENPQIVSLKTMQVRFVRGEGEFGQHTWEAWEHLWEKILKTHQDYSKFRLFAMSHDNPDLVQENHRYDACIAGGDAILLEGRVGKRTIEGGCYARFIHRGSYKNFKYSFSAIYLLWAIKTQKQLVEKPWLVEFLNWQLHESHPDQLQSYIYIPIKSK